MNIFSRGLRTLLVSASVLLAQFASADVGIYGANDQTWNEEVRDKIAAEAGGSLGAVAFHDAQSATPTLGELLAYTAVLVYSDDDFLDATAFGDVLADYVDAGGTVVFATFVYNINPIGGRIVTGDYMPLTLGAQDSPGGLTLVPVLPGHPLLAGVTSLNGGTSSYHNIVTPTAGATLVANWSNGRPLIAVKGSVVGLNFYPPSSDSRVDFWDATTDGARIMANALGQAGAGFGPGPATPVPTLSEWSMIILFGLLALGAILALRRRQRV